MRTMSNSSTTSAAIIARTVRGRIRGFGFAILIAVSLYGQPSSPPRVTYKVGEIILRQQAVTKPLPLYPPDSQTQNHTGVAVAAVVVAPDGHVSSVKLLDSPDAAIAEAVSKAVGMWRFTSLTYGDEPVEMTGKLVFYFVNRSGKWSVFSPAERFATRSNQK
jgi:TonB family protein